MENLFISLEKEVFKGNILDFTHNNESIIYSANKFFDNYMDIDYIESKIIENIDNYNSYDSCILFFVLNKLNSFKSRKKLFDKIYSVLKEGGYVYIWDVEKKPFTIINKPICIGLPDKTITRFNIKSFNIIFKCNSNSIIEELKECFDVEEIIQSKDAFKIVCRRKDVKN